MSGHAPNKTPQEQAKDIIIDNCDKLNKQLHSNIGGNIQIIPTDNAKAAVKAIEEIEEHIRSGKMEKSYIENRLPTIRNAGVYLNDKHIVNIESSLDLLSYTGALKQAETDQLQTKPLEAGLKTPVANSPRFTDEDQEDRVSKKTKDVPVKQQSRQGSPLAQVAEELREEDQEDLGKDISKKTKDVPVKQGLKPRSPLAKVAQELEQYDLINSQSTQTEPEVASKFPTIELVQGEAPKPQNQQIETKKGLLDNLGFSSPKLSDGSYVHYGDEEKNIKAHYQVDHITGSSKEISELYENGIMKFDGDDPSAPNKAQIHGEMSPAAKKGVVLLLEGVSKSNQDNEQNINVTISHFEDKDLLDILEKFHSNLNEKLKDPIGSDLQKIRCVEINYKGGDPKVKELIDEHNKVAKDTINVSTMSAEIKQAAHATLMEKIQSTKESLKTEPSDASKPQHNKPTH